MALEIRLLGPPRIEKNGEALHVDTRKAIALLAYLAVTQAEHSRDSLVALLWPESDRSRGRAALRRTLSTLNRALAGEGIHIGREAVALDQTAEIWLDIVALREQIAAGSLAEAAELFRADFLAGFTLRDSPTFDEWQFFQTEALQRELAAVLAQLTEDCRTQGDYERGVEYARRLLALDSLNEAAHRQLMQTYAAKGEHSAALRQYRECVRILDQELGVPPLEETTALYEQLLQQRTTEERRTPIRDLHSLARSAVQPARLPIVGREAEWSALLAEYAAIQNEGHLIVIEGEAGIGKTRLAEAFVSHLRERGAVALTGRGFPGEGDLAYAPVVQLIQDIVDTPELHARLQHLPDAWRAAAARLLPQAAEHMPEAPPTLASGSQHRFFEAISQVLLICCKGAQAGLIFIDDLNWADSATIDLLTYMLRRATEQPLCVIVAWRSEAVPAGHRLRALAAELRRANRSLSLQLERLDDVAVGNLVEAALEPQAATEVLKQQLFRDTEGVPYFVVEYLRMLQDDPASYIAGETSMPASVRDLLQSILVGLSETGQQLLGAAAVIGRSFRFDILRAASGRSDVEAVGGLEELIARGLVAEVAAVESGADLEYDFSHAQIRALLYAETSLARRRLLHRRVAEALAARQQISVTASQIAQHFQFAGEEARAAEYFVQAGDLARSVSANAEAGQHYNSAIALGYPDVARLHAALGDVHTLNGEFEAALARYETAAAHAELEAASLARIEHKVAEVHTRLGQWELAERYFRSALERTQAADLQAQLYADWSRSVQQRGDSAHALTLAQTALALAEESGDARALAQSHNVLGILANHAADPLQAREHLSSSLELAEQLASPEARIAALNNLALAHSASGETARALALSEAALQLCATLGDRHREAALRNNIADILHRAGRGEEAMEWLKQAVAIFAEIGVDEGGWQPEVWKLVEW